MAKIPPLVEGPRKGGRNPVRENFAEVGEPSKMFAYISGQSDGKIAELEAREEYALGHLGSQIEENERLRAELAATIERCAGELDRLRQHEFGEADQFAIGFNEAIKQAQFRIRALKEKS